MQRPPVQLLSWPSLHLTEAETRGPAILVVLSVLLGVVTLLVGVRIYTRCRITHGFGSDDGLILLAFMTSTAFSVAGIVGELKLQWGRHVWDLLPGSIVPGLKLTLSMQVLFDASTNLTKLSMLALFIRITHVSGQHAARRLAVYLAAAVLAGAVVFLFVDVFQCRPLSAYWTFSAAPRHCINQTTHLLAAGSINTVIDLVIAVVFPIQYWSAVDKAVTTTTTAAKQPDTPRFKYGHRRSKNRSVSSYSSSGGTSTSKLSTGKAPARKRIGCQWPPAVVGSLFVGGLLVVAAGAARTVYTWRAMTSADGDITWNTAPALISSALELNISIIVASLPALKPFFCRFLPDCYAGAQSKFTRRRTQWQGHAEKRIEATSASIISLSSLRTLLFQSRDNSGAAKPHRPPLDLNKPLPTLLRSQEDVPDVQDELQSPVEYKRPGTWYSVYDFQADADGYIRVRKASWEDLVSGPGGGTSQAPAASRSHNE